MTELVITLIEKIFLVKTQIAITLISRRLSWSIRRNQLTLFEGILYVLSTLILYYKVLLLTFKKLKNAIDPPDFISKVIRHYIIK